MEYARRYADEYQSTQVDGTTVYYHLPPSVSEGQAAGAPDAQGSSGAAAPLVIFMCGTGGDPRGDAAWSGWIEECDREGLVLATPDYENYDTYGQTDFLDDVIAWALRTLPVDSTRVYSVGFSNGGATSVALANDHPERLAGIAAAGWMVPLRQVEGPAMPFQLVQGSGEFTERADDGSMQVMPDEREALRTLMARDGIAAEGAKADYARTPYWGYAPDATWARKSGGFTWEGSDYHVTGWDAPLAELVLVDDDIHRPRPDEARLAWRFLRRFLRVDGELVTSSG